MSATEVRIFMHKQPLSFNVRCKQVASPPIPEAHLQALSSSTLKGDSKLLERASILMVEDDQVSAGIRHWLAQTQIEFLARVLGFVRS